MQNKSMGLTIFHWLEVVVALRILLFTVPVLLSKCLAGSFSLLNVTDGFIVVTTFTAVVYFIIGLVSIFGSHFWRFFHYLVTVMILLLTASFINVVTKTNSMLEIYYFYPVIFSVLIAVWVGLTKEKVKSTLT